jgi:hypothetical protein
MATLEDRLVELEREVGKARLMSENAARLAIGVQAANVTIIKALVDAGLVDARQLTGYLAARLSELPARERFHAPYGLVLGDVLTALSGAPRNDQVAQMVHSNILQVLHG